MKQTLKPAPARYRITAVRHPPSFIYARAIVEIPREEPIDVQLISYGGETRLIPSLEVRIIKGGPIWMQNEIITLELIRLKKLRLRAGAVCNCRGYRFPHRRGVGLCYEPPGEPL